MCISNFLSTSSPYPFSRSNVFSHRNSFKIVQWFSYESGTERGIFNFILLVRIVIVIIILSLIVNYEY